ncbi:hypothetical protein QTN24_01440 [Cupriavidus sp. SZY C1]|uniref:hypothetical protein n=1 Tax=Cupriavidus sp. SZY C1 TaxID=3055037 RepID=UPI0028BC9483|nr:hypothetical protein [Cupriavidus sp. SZY C1]MDT6960148.1 hypothetical protein [Cupriavidus sp. SZY C1]
MKFVEFFDLVAGKLCHLAGVHARGQRAHEALFPLGQVFRAQQAFQASRGASADHL